MQKVRILLFKPDSDLISNSRKAFYTVVQTTGIVLQPTCKEEFNLKHPFILFSVDIHYTGIYFILLKNLEFSTRVGTIAY